MSDTLRVSNVYAGTAIGIGKTPAYALDVVGSINLTGSILVGGSTFSTSQWTTTGSNVYYNTGSIGIGTNAPSAVLDVGGSFRVLSQTYTALTSGTGIDIIYSGGGTLSSGTRGAGGVLTASTMSYAASTHTFYTGTNASTSAMTIASAGSVGIGKTNPRAALDIVGAVNYPNGTDATQVYISDTTGTGLMNLLLGTNGTTNYASIQSSLSGTGPKTLTLNPAGGYVGVGTTNPSSKFQVYQDGNSMLNEGNPHSLTILSHQGTGGVSQMLMMIDADYTNQCCSIQSIVNALKVYNLSLNPRGGNVGVGTTNPTGTFHIFGSSVPSLNLSNTTTVNYTQQSSIGFNYGGGATSGTVNSFQIFSQTVNRDNGAGPNYDYGAQCDLVFQRKSNNLYSGNAGDKTYTEVMRLSGITGYLGVGTNNPTGMIHAQAGQWPYGSFVASNASNPSQQLVIGTYWTGTAATSYSALQSVTQNVANNNLALNPYAGNVGIGLTNPSALLHVNGAAIITGSLSVNGSAVPVSSGSVWATGAGGSISYGSGVVNITAGSKIGIQNNADGGTANGIYYWNTGDTNWVGYMGTAGAGKSASGGTACTGAFGFTAHALRNRVTNASTQGFIWENLAETCLMSIRGDGVGGGVIGSWGVGTVSPNAIVHIYNTAGDRTTSLNVETMRAGIQLKSTGASGGNFNIWSSLTGETPGAGALCFYDNTNTAFRMVINSSGYVGINMPTPTNMLYVTSNSYTKPVFVVDSISVTGGGTVASANAPRGIGQPLIGVGNYSFSTDASSGDYYGIGFGYAGGSGTNHYAGEIGMLITSTAAGEMGDLVFSTRATTTHATIASERMRITSTGNVGIGMTNPNYLLCIPTAVTTNLFNFLNTGGAGYGFYCQSSNIASRGNTMDWYAADYNFGTSTTRSVFTMRPEGLIGIGTTTPNYVLSVSGTSGTGILEVNRTGASTNYGVPIVHTLTSATGSFRGEYARVFGGTNGTIATTAQSQANGYYCIDIANAGVFQSDTNAANSAFYMTNSQTRMNGGDIMVGWSSYTATTYNDPGYNLVQGIALRGSNNSCSVICATSYIPFCGTKYGIAGGYMATFSYCSAVGVTGSLIGSITHNASTVAFNTSSDARLKENIQDVTDARSMIDKLRPRTFTFVRDEVKDVHIGFIAQEVREHYPHYVAGKETDTDFLAMDYGKISPFAIAACKELYKENDALRAQVSALQSQLDAIMARLAAAGI